MTPWQKVFEKFGMSKGDLAMAMGRDRSKIVRHLLDEKGLISGRDQEKLLQIAGDRGVDLRPEDLVPSI